MLGWLGWYYVVLLVVISTIVLPLIVRYMNTRLIQFLSSVYSSVLGDNSQSQRGGLGQR
jgi:uncharacterized protein involved in cysteine biosynthesis